MSPLFQSSYERASAIQRYGFLLTGSLSWDEGDLDLIVENAIAYVSRGPVGLGVLHSFAYGVPVVTLSRRSDIDQSFIILSTARTPSRLTTRIFFQSIAASLRGIRVGSPTRSRCLPSLRECQNLKAYDCRISGRNLAYVRTGCRYVLSSIQIVQSEVLVLVEAESAQ